MFRVPPPASVGHLQVARLARRRRRGQSNRRARLAMEPLESRAMLAGSFVPGELLVRFAADADTTGRADARSLVGGTLAEEIHTAAMKSARLGVLERIQLPGGWSVEQAAKVLNQLPQVAVAEPNWWYAPTVESNDTHYVNGNLWGMYSGDTPAAAGPSGTTNAYGSQAEQAWAGGHTGSRSVVVGIIDEGIQFTHPDLDANIWTNSWDPVDGEDNDGNGFVDDVHGWDFYNGDNSVYDSTGDDHATHVAGTIGAEGGNGAGVAGVNWDVTMISAKFLGSNGGTTSGAVQALDYLTDLKQRHGINLVATNNSWGGGGFSQSLLDAISRAANAGILFVAAAGNGGADGVGDNNDTTAQYPANYDTSSQAGYDAVISVAAITSSGARSGFSNYGATQVDLGAPGSTIASTVPSNAYAYYSGTSMATPHVTGAVALYASKYPQATAAQIKDAILRSVTATTSLSGLTVTGGRLNVEAALNIAPNAAPELSVDDVSVTEGNSGTTRAQFTVRLSSASSDEVQVEFVTADGSADADGDYTASSGTVTFPAGESTQTITIDVQGDTLAEGDETFFVNLQNALNATLGDAQGEGTILDDDSLPGLTISDVAINEGHRGSRTMNFTVTLSAAATSNVSVAYATDNGTALAGSDYVAKSGTLTIPAGSTSRTIGVSILGDRSVELDETLFLNLSAPTAAVLHDPQGVGTIRNDDTAKLVAAGRRVAPGGETLTSDTALDLLVQEALSRWQSAGVDPARIDQASLVEVRVAKLPGRTLGMASTDTLWLDEDAAGFGWFVDPTPADDSEFTTAGDQGEQGRIDLLTALIHEFGHWLGLDHSHHGVMSEALFPGTRRSAELHDADHEPATAARKSLSGLARAQALDHLYAELDSWRPWSAASKRRDRR